MSEQEANQEAYFYASKRIDELEEENKRLQAKVRGLEQAVAAARRARTVLAQDARRNQG